MKKRLGLLLAVSAMALGLGGAFAMSTVNGGANKVEEASAAGSSKTVYIDPNMLGISNCYVYIKNADDSDNGWPGKHISTITNYGTVTGEYYDNVHSEYATKTFYKFEINTTSKEIQITNSNGDICWNQWNISSVASSEWNLVQLTNWDWGYNAHHMHKIEIVDGDSNTYYEYNPAEWGAYHLPTHGLNDRNFYGWYINGDHSGTKFLDNGEYGMATDNSNDMNFTAYYDSHVYGRYLTGNFDGCNWGIEGAVYMTPTDGQYVANITLEYGDKYKTVYYGGGDVGYHYGYSSVRTGCGAYQYLTNDGDDNIVSRAKGTYSVYFRDVEYETGKKLSIELSSVLNAEHLAVQLVDLSEYAGHCGDSDRFPAMKTIYLGLSSTEQTAFQDFASSSTDQFKNAYERYTAWARALGENPWASGKSASRIDIIPGLSAENTSIIVPVIIATMLAVIAAGGYFFLRKKEN